MGLSSYGIGLLAQVPFMITPLFTGPLAEPLQGIDIAWLVGFAVTAAVYLLLVRRRAQRRTLEQDSASASESRTASELRTGSA